MITAHIVIFIEHQCLPTSTRLLPKPAITSTALISVSAALKILNSQTNLDTTTLWTQQKEKVKFPLYIPSGIIFN